MPTERLFDVVFEGRPLPEIPLEKAIVALANLTRKQPNDIAHLFNERSTVLKRGISKEKALQYRKALQNAGLACRIINAGSPLDTGKPEKSSDFDVNSASTSPVNGTSVQQKVAPPQHKAENKESYQFHFPERGWLGSIASLSFLLPQSLELETAPTDLPPATIGQRVWSAVSTFFHGVFMGYVLAFPVGLVVGLHLRFSDADVTRSTIEATRGGSMLLGMVAAVLLLPLLWRGHSFGQRALGVMVVPTTDEDVDDLSGSAIMMRRLTFRTRCACAEPMSSRPWNSAMVPFAAAILLHLVMIPFGGAFLWISGSFDHNSRQDRVRSHSYKEATANLVTRNQHILRQLDPAIRTYILESGMTPVPLTPTVFKKVLRQNLPPGFANELLEKLDNGSLKLHGDLAEYQIGIYENDHWTILNEQGEIRQEKEF